VGFGDVGVFLGGDVDVLVVFGDVFSFVRGFFFWEKKKRDFFLDVEEMVTRDPSI